MSVRQQLDMLNAQIEVLQDNIARCEDKVRLAYLRERLKIVRREHAGLIESQMR